MKRKEMEDRQTAMTPEELLMGDSEEVSKGGFMGESEGVSKGVLMGESEERGGFKGSKGGLMAESEERGGFRSVLWGGYRECSRALLLCVSTTPQLL